MLCIEGIRKVFNPGTINEKVALSGLSLTLEDGDFAKLTPCPKCTTLLRKPQIDEMNRLENPDLY